MRVIIAPLNWGLGHASRCVPLVRRYLSMGYTVTLAGDGASLLLLRKMFPDLPVLALSSLTIRYSGGRSQVWAMLRCLPRIILAAIRDHRLLRRYLRDYPADLLISDNRFGAFSSRTHSVYITHQLTIPLPTRWHFLEPCLAGLHRRLIRCFDECWVPDYPLSPDSAPAKPFDGTLAGRLSHPAILPPNTKYIGPLSRFSGLSVSADSRYHTVVVLSGPEPQRTMFEQQITAKQKAPALIVQGLINRPATVVSHGQLTIVPYLDDAHLASFLLGAKRIICRSGYTSVMDMSALGVLPKVEWYPTPGQPEQEYLATLFGARAVLV